MATVQDPAAARIWNQQSIWSQAADQAKKSISTARTTGLTLGIVAAVLGTAASQIISSSAATGKALALLGAVAAGLAPAAAARSGPRRIRDWTRLRSVSEALKSEIYTYLARVSPYRGTDAVDVLVERTDRLLADASDLAHHTLSLTPAQRPLPDVDDAESYADVRLRRQISHYYRPRAALMRQRFALIRRTELTLTATATVLGAISTVFGVGQTAGWVATVTTVAAVVTAHAAASRYAYQEIEFARTAAELERLLAHRTENPKPGSAADDTFVNDCERIISVQNEAWMVKWEAR